MWIKAVKFIIKILFFKEIIMDSNKREQTDLNTNGNNVVLMLDSNDNDSMLSLKDLLYAVLRNLGIILIVAVLLGGALFA